MKSFHAQLSDVEGARSGQNYDILGALDTVSFASVQSLDSRIGTYLVILLTPFLDCLPR